MEGRSKEDEASPQLLNWIPKDREWLLRREEQRRHGSSEEKKLELRLGPPGEDWSIKDGTRNNSRETDDSVLSLGYFSDMGSLTHNTNNNSYSNNINLNKSTTSGAKRGFTDAVDMKVENSWIMNNNGSQNQKFSFSENPVGTTLSTPWSSSSYQKKTQQQQQQTTNAPFLLLQSNPQSLPVMAKESSQPCTTKAVNLQNAEKKAFSSAPANTAVPNSSQKRTAPASVVGWPPIRSFRKNLASSSSSKPPPESQDVVPSKVPSEQQFESFRKGYFVKINMDGVPIGRKVDLKAYDSYQKLSSAVDELFRGLLAAQRDTSVDGIQNKPEGEKAITGLLDGSGEYTLVYEDNEGDRMLVGDVPWHMFVSTVKRLRVLKSSDLSKLCIGNKQEKIPLDGSK